MKLSSLEALEGQLRPEGWLAAMGALIALLLLAAYLYVFKADLQIYRELRAEWSPDGVASTEVRASEAEGEIARLEAELRALETRIFGGASGLPREQVESHIIARLDELSAERAVRLNSVMPGAAGRVLSFDELPYDVDVSGDYFALFDWLGAVETELRPLVVKRFQITPDRRAQGEVHMQLRLVSYRPGEEAS